MKVVFCGSGGAAPLQNRDDEGGRWVTIQGRPVFIKEGESLDEALARKSDGKGDEKPENKGQTGPDDTKEGSTSDGKNAKIKESQGEQDRAKSSPGKRDRLAESALHVTRGDDPGHPSHDEPTEQRDARNKRERTALYNWAEENDKLKEKPWKPDPGWRLAD